MQEQIKDVALEQLAVGGPQAISLNAIAKQLGVSGPALYRYYPRRDDLITALVLDAYHDLRRAVASAVAAADPGAAGLRAYVQAFHDFARAHPHRYGLLFTAPVPDYDNNAAPLVVAAQGLMDELLRVLRVIGPDHPDVETVAVLAWSRIHGIVSLDLAQVYASMNLDATRLVGLEVDALVAELQGP